MTGGQPSERLDSPGAVEDDAEQGQDKCRGDQRGQDETVTAHHAASGVAGFWIASPG